MVNDYIICYFYPSFLMFGFVSNPLKNSFIQQRLGLPHYYCLNYYSSSLKYLRWLQNFDFLQ